MITRTPPAVAMPAGQAFGWWERSLRGSTAGPGARIVAASDPGGLHAPSQALNREQASRGPPVGGGGDPLGREPNPPRQLGQAGLGLGQGYGSRSDAHSPKSRPH